MYLSTLAPDLLRAILLAFASGMAICTFPKTDFGSKNPKFKIPAGLIFVLVAILLYFAPHWWETRGARFALARVDWDHPTVNLGKVPCTNASLQRLLPNGTCEVIVPPGILGTTLHAEIKMRNEGNSSAADVYWYGGTVISDPLDAAGEDVLFGQLTTQQIETWPEFTVKELRTLTVRNGNPTPWDANKVRYLMLRASFHDGLGPQPDVELCKRYGGKGKSLFEADHLDEFCKGHNRGVILERHWFRLFSEN